MATEQEITDRFESIWLLGPWLRLGKKAAARHFKATVKTAQDWQDIQLAREVYVAHLTAHAWKHPQHGSTWFNSWHDWLFYPLAAWEVTDPLFLAVEGSRRGQPLTEREQEGARELIALRAKRGL